MKGGRTMNNDFWYPNKEQMEFMQRTSSEMMKQKHKRERKEWVKMNAFSIIIGIATIIGAISAVITLLLQCGILP